MAVECLIVDQHGINNRTRLKISIVSVKLPLIFEIGFFVDWKND